MHDQTQSGAGEGISSPGITGAVTDGRGRPLSGIAVSDGLRVTRTDGAGAFRFPRDAGADGDRRGSGFVTVTVPGDRTTDQWFLPADHDGELTFVLDPVGDPDAAALPYRFAHLTDLHIGDAGMYPPPAEIGDAGILAQLLRTIGEEHRVASFAITGDLTDCGADDQYMELRRGLRHSPCPVRTVPGNHDHMAGNRYHPTVSRTGYAIHTGDPSAYEKWMGPRWYSFDVPGLHVVCMDWLTDELDLDSGTQRAWLAEDLAAWDAGEPGQRPWILLYHDQPTRDLLGGAPYPPLATFSGHRHTDRIIEVDGVLHVNTPPAMFGGVDHTPASYRIVEWDGERIHVTTARSFPPADAGGGDWGNDVVPIWERTPAMTGFRAVSVTETETGIVVASRSTTGPDGRLSCLDPVTGQVNWEVSLGAWPALDAPPSGTDAETAYVVVGLVDGSVVAVDQATGAIAWKFSSTDPMRRFSLHSPAIAGDTVIAGDVSDTVGVAVGDGHLRWRRRDLADYQIFITMAAAAPRGGHVAVGSFPAPDHISVLDAATGETLGPCGVAAGSAAMGESPFDAASLPVATPVWAGPTSLIVPALAGTACLNPFNGAVAWARQGRQPWSAASPVRVPSGVVITDPSGEVALLDAETGEVRWARSVAGTPLLSCGTYRRTPEPLHATPAVDEDLLLVPTLCASVVVIDVETGAGDRVIPTCAPVTVTPVANYDGARGVAARRSVITVESDGGVRCYPYT